MQGEAYTLRIDIVNTDDWIEQSGVLTPDYEGSSFPLPYIRDFKSWLRDPHEEV